MASASSRKVQAVFVLLSVLLLLNQAPPSEAMRGYGRTIYVGTKINFSKPKIFQKVANKAIPAYGYGGGRDSSSSPMGRRISPRVHYFVPVNVWNSEGQQF